MIDPDDCIHRISSATIEFCYCSPKMPEAAFMSRCREYLDDYTHEVLQAAAERAVSWTGEVFDGVWDETTDSIRASIMDDGKEKV